MAEKDLYGRIEDIKRMVDQAELNPNAYQFINIRLELNKLQKQVQELIRAASDPLAAG